MSSSQVARLVVSLTLLLSISSADSAAWAIPATRVFLNGRPSPVYFNDGDSFRVLAGPLQGTRARLAGFNTLETFGGVHRWGTWTPKELFWNAKKATLNGQRGVWHCESKDMKRDTYGRILWHCTDLGVDQVRQGLAHAMSVNYMPARPPFMAAQLDAIKHKRGMWAHGVPEYILTSIHSKGEGGGRDGKTYNRLVSSRDGHSAKWEHNVHYKKCEWVCSKERRVEESVIDAAHKQLAGDADFALVIQKLKKFQLKQIISDYARLGYFVGVKNPATEKAITAKLEQLAKDGKFGNKPFVEGSCALYVPFRERYGKGRAACLK